MTEENKRIFLKGGDYYLTESPTDAFKVVSGSLLVYIVPYERDEVGRRSLVYEAEEGEVLPGFSYRDIEYHNWRFCFVALEEAEISVIENGCTKILKERFSYKAKIKNYKIEGFNEGLVDQYRINVVTEDGFIRRTQKDRETAASRSFNLILSSFKKNNIGIDIEKSGNRLYDACYLLCKKYHISIVSYDRLKEACGSEFGICDIARISHFAYREVMLTEGWEKLDSGAFLVFDSEEKPCVCLPKGNNGYILYDLGSDKTTVVSSKVAQSLSKRAYMIYRPFPAGKVTKKDILKFCAGSIRKTDIVWLVLLSVVTALIGLITPVISQSIYDVYTPLGAKEILLQVGCLMASFMIANILFSIVKNLTEFRITSKMSYDVQNAVFDRLFNLPESFFRKVGSADTTMDIIKAGPLTNKIASVFLTSIVSGIFLIVFLIKMISYSGKLTVISLLMVLAFSVIYSTVSLLKARQNKISDIYEDKANSLMYQFLNGISKIRITGVEDRAIFEYLKQYIKFRDSEEKKKNYSDIGTVLSLIANSCFSIILYIVMVHSKAEISVGTFIAFSTVFGGFALYTVRLVQGLLSIREDKSDIDGIRIILDEVPEYDDGKELPGDISGAIEINNVTFSYSSDTQNILENVNLNILPGEYVGIVGPSGSGKSTLLKMLLGFEKPVSGKIYYDNKDIESIDKRELRKKMGVVLQDGKLISGNILENIMITAPKASIQKVREVINAVGLDKDIEKLPMGLNTLLSEESQTISGGQLQRILIARAILSNPSILFFDEATNALDNVTQKMICEILEKMKSTRIVIAHRLSTVINCDRIIVLNEGRVEEQGCFEELMEKKGLFYKLASRQMA